MAPTGVCGCLISVDGMNNAGKSCGQPQFSPAGVTRVHTNQPGSTPAEQSLRRAFNPMHRLVGLRIAFLSYPSSTPLRSLPEPGSLWTHCQPHRSAPDASSQLLTCCQTTAAGTCHQAGRATWLCSQAARLGKDESAVSCLRGLRWSVTQGPQEINYFIRDPRMVPAGNSVQPQSVGARKTSPSSCSHPLV